MKRINANGYGFVLVPVSTFEQFRQTQKIRAKKMLTYFAKNKVMGDAFLQNGCMLPIAHINYAQYAVYITVGQSEIPAGWKTVREWRTFNICADADDSLWVVSLVDLEPWNSAVYEGQLFCQQKNVCDFYNKPLERYHAIRYDVPCGKYEAAVIGLQKEDAADQYGFLFVLTPVEEFVINADASETAFNEIFSS